MGKVQEWVSEVAQLFIASSRPQAAYAALTHVSSQVDGFAEKVTCLTTRRGN